MNKGGGFGGLIQSKFRSRSPRETRGSNWLSLLPSTGQQHQSAAELAQKAFWGSFLSHPSQWWDDRPNQVDADALPSSAERMKNIWAVGLKCPTLQIKQDRKGGAVGPSWDDPQQQQGWVEENREENQLIEVVDALDLLVEEGCHVPSSLYYFAIKGCTERKALNVGMHVHSLAVESGYESDTFLANHIIRMYASHGRMQEALQVFTRPAAPDFCMWASMIWAHAQRKEHMQAVQLYRQMQESGLKPDNFIHVTVLKACATAADLMSGKQVHAGVLESVKKPDMFVGSSLVDMYAKCGSLEDARRVFDSLQAKSVVTWNAMFSGYAQHGLGHEALSLYTDMQQEGTIANHVTFGTLLKACAKIGALHAGKELHFEICERGLVSNLALGNSLVDMYAKCGNLGDARTVFDELPFKDVVTWTAMIAGYVQHGLGEEALSLYSAMQQGGIIPANLVTFVCLLKACALVGALHQGKELHSQVQERGLEMDLIIGNCLVDMYVKCGDLEDARKVFDSMPAKDVVTWTTMIAGYAHQGLGHESLTLHASMQQEGITPANSVTFVCLLKACASIGALLEGRELHSQLQEMGVKVDTIVGSSLVDMYAKCGSLEDAHRVFDGLPKRDVATWNAVLAAYCQRGLGRDVLSLYRTMQQEGIKASHVTFVCLLKACASIGALAEGKELHSEIQEWGLEADVAVGNCLVDMYAKCGSLEDARRVFDRLPTRDVVTWNAMITGYAQHGLGEAALSLYASMQQLGITSADPVTFVCVLKACAAVGALHQGKRLHSCIREMGLEADVVLGNGLVDMYAKLGSLEDARGVFDRLLARDTVTWNALLNGYALHNEAQMAIHLFQEMQWHKVEPDAATFICLLSACSHGGLVKEGQQYFKQMVEEYGIVPTAHHYTCMADILGRSGLLNEAERLLQTMPFETDMVGWTSLLSNCRSHGEIERGERCFNRLIKLQPQNATPYVLLGNLYASAGRWIDVSRVENMRNQAGAYKKPARAWIEVDNKVQSFVVGEERSDISGKLRSVNERLMEEGGHLPHTELVLKPVAEAEKVDALCGHAEKLALAYGLLNTPPGTTLLVTKNLRMCNDCHSGTKILSRIEKREIIVRDAHRVHHFVDGFCSCRDLH